MPTWSKRGLRGSLLEEQINRTNAYYREQGLALIQKIPTPITPVEYEKNSHQIKLAYFDKKSTVDYIGVVQGVPVCFDAKECASDRFAISNIHEHQYLFMKDFEIQEGLAFILIYYSKLDKYYYMRFKELDNIYRRYQNNELKSFHISSLYEEYFIKTKCFNLVHYLDGIKLDLSSR